MRRIVLAASAAALLTSAAAPSAVAAGGYLKLREANVLAHRDLAGQGGHTTVEPCTRVDSRRAACVFHSHHIDGNIACTWTLYVTKSYADGRFRWAQRFTGTTCEPQ